MIAMKVFLNGRILPIEAAQISILDRGLLYGDGVFESIRTYNRRPFLLDEHLKRLLSGVKLLRIPLPYSLPRVRSAVLKTIAANPSFKECYIKIIVTRGEAKAHGLVFSNSTGKPNLIILVEELKEYPQSAFIQGWKAIISSIRKVDVPTARIKSLCYLDNAIAKEEARNAGANEAFMLDEKGHIIEGAISNIFMIKLETICTPPREAPILCGITRDLVIKLAKESALRLIEHKITAKELYNCDECFIAMSGAGIIPITKIGSRNVGNGKSGPITKKLLQFYEAETRK